MRKAIEQTLKLPEVRYNDMYGQLGNRRGLSESNDDLKNFAYSYERQE